MVKAKAKDIHAVVEDMQILRTNIVATTTSLYCTVCFETSFWNVCRLSLNGPEDLPSLASVSEMQRCFFLAREKQLFKDQSNN